MPGYLEHQDALKELGVENVIIFCVNDGAVMGIWNKEQVESYGKPNTLVTFFGDPAGELTRACGMELTDPRPIEKGLIGRCKRFAMYVVNSVVQYVVVCESEDDPAGDEDPSATCAPALIEAIQSLRTPAAA